MATKIQSLYHDCSMLKLSLRKTSVIFLLIVGIIGSIWFWNRSSKQAGYVFDTVKKTDVTEIVSDSGKIISDGKVDVTSPTNGIITDIAVKNGQAVKENQELFTVKSNATLQEQQNAFAAYQSAVAAQNAAETLLHTYRSQMYTAWKQFTDMATNSTYESSKGVPNEEARKAAEFQSTQDTWFAAEKQFKDQEQAVSAAQAQVAATWIAYLATQTSTVTAPIAGVVANVAVSVGKSVSATTLTSLPTIVLTIVNSNNVEGILTIGQTDIAKVKEGQIVNVFPDAYKDNTYVAKVVRVDTLGQENLGVVGYNVYITFRNSDELLRSGMTIDGDIITKEEKHVLSIPNSAIVLYNGKKTVRIFKNSSLVYIPIQVGIKGETRTQIVSGLAEGQQIIVALTNLKAARPSFMGL